MTTLINSFEGGTSGTTISTGNSGGLSGNAFDAVTIGGGATFAFDNTHAAHGGLSCKIATGASAAALAAWSTSLGSNAQVWFRIYLYITSVASIRFLAAQAGASEAASVRVNGSNHLVLEDASFTGRATFTNAIPTSQWFRVEGYFIGNASAGAVSASMYDAPDSAVATETQTATGLNTTGAITQVQFGLPFATASIGPFWQDDLGVSTTGYLGPASTVSTTDSTPVPIFAAALGV